MSSLHREAMSRGLPPRPCRGAGAGAGGSRFAGLVPKRKKKDYEPVSWSEYFENEHDVLIGEDSFHVYTSGSTGPLVLLLHGAGHSALSWAVFTKTLLTTCECRVMAMDFRGHGSTTTSDDLNMDAKVMAQDVANVVEKLFGSSREEVPPIVMLGHSMGGAIAVHVAVNKLIPSLRGLAVIDVVEGTALDALPAMQSFLRSRPSQFKSLATGVEWSVRSGQLRNVESAKVSMTGQLKKVSTELSNTQQQSVSMCDISEDLSEMTEEPTTATANSSLQEQKHPQQQQQQQQPQPQQQPQQQQQQQQQPQQQMPPPQSPQQSPGETYIWRVNLAQTEPYWEGWFRGMSSLFLSCPVPKLLILAGVDRLDKELTIGQMQGKFQMQILANCGHMVHEDVPDKVANLLTTFLLRQKLAQAKDGFQRTMPEC